MNLLDKGSGELLGWHDPDEEYEWICSNKKRDLEDKRVNLDEAVKRLVKKGGLIAFGGFGHVRVSMAAVYEIIRQQITDLKLLANPGVHDSDLLIASGCVSNVEVAYAFGHELRGLSPASRRAIENGLVKVSSEISNAALQWRFKAAAMGIPFMPTRTMLGTETFRHSSARIVDDPFSGKRICLVPACSPDVAIIHVHRCDKYGNAQIDGITVKDVDLSRAARRLIITAESVVDETCIRNKPWLTTIPYYVVDSVTQVPYGAHPGSMPYLYYSDEEHLAEWLRVSRTTAGTREYIKKHVYGVSNFEEYLKTIGGPKRLEYLERVEKLEVPMRVPWIEE